MKSCSSWICYAVILLALVTSGVLSATGFAVTVSPIFRSNMVLQRGTTVPVFGTGNPGDTVTVSLLNQNVSAVVGADGTWRVNLASMSVNNASNTMTVTETGQVPVTFTGAQLR